MSTILKKTISLFIVFLSLYNLSAEDFTIYLFGSKGCEQCERVEYGVVKDVLTEYPNVTCEKTLIDSMDGFKKLLSFEEKYGDNRNEAVKVFVGEKCLAGVDDIEANLSQEIQRFITANAEVPADVPVVRDTSLDYAEARVESFTIWAVITAGLVDGVNPCVFSTLVFFMGLLAASNVKGRKLLTIGLSFCCGSFVMYTAMGFGAMQLLRSFWGFEIIQVIVKISMVCIMTFFAVSTFREAYTIRKSGIAVGDACNLPVGIVGKIHRAIREGIGTRNLVLGAFGCGLIVTAFESMCTGQVYVPTLVLIIQSGVSLVKGWALLLLFNVACILPLLTVFLLVYQGMNFSHVEDWMQKNVFKSKLFLGLFFLMMAILIISF